MAFLMEFLLLVAVAVLFWQLRKMSQRIAQLERLLAVLQMPRAIPPAAAKADVPTGDDSPPVVVPEGEQVSGPVDETLPKPGPAPEPEHSGPWDLDGTETLPPLPIVRPEAPSRLGLRMAALARWLVSNWVYAVAAVSLILAGVFLVQYGVEQGLLPPAARVVAALVLGFALIAGGETIRRRWGDSPDRSTAYLPSTFSGAGIVALFVGVFAARQLYGLIGVEAAFAGFLAVAVVALLLGWFHGPFLAAIGLIGAGATPFVVGGGAEAPVWLPFYYALLTAVGLGIDTLRRWAWVSVLALVIGFGGLMLLELAGVNHIALALAVTTVPLLAMAIPARSLWPDEQGSTLMAAVLRRRHPGFPTLLAGCAVLVAVAKLVFLSDAGLVALACLAALVVLVSLWAAGAPALADLAGVSAAGFVLRLVAETQGWPLWQQVRAGEILRRAPETSAPPALSLVVALALAGSLAAAVRSLRGGDYPKGWAALAALFAPVTLLVLELLWQPVLVLGPGLWAGHVIALAAVMVALSERFARADGGPGARSAYTILAALSLIALALFVILTKAALTLALAVLLVVAAALDRRLRLPEMGWFTQAAVAVIGWRLIVVPGFVWATEAPLWEVWLSYGSAILGAAAGRALLADLHRPPAQLALESTAIVAAALLADVLLLRWLETQDRLPEHAGVTIVALPWILVMFAQLYRSAANTGWLRRLRMVLALVAGVIGIGGVLVAALVLNPVQAGWLGSDVLGPVLLSSLTIAYALPGALLIFGARRIAMPRGLSLALRGIGGAFMALWVALEIRHFWHGSDLAGAMLQGELYSYTVALLLAGAVVLYLAISRGSDLLRRVAMGLIALTVAKVFLIDAAGLTGLMRVASFLGLGLSLAGLAWLNRWTAQKGMDRTRPGQS